jgi:rubredoxin
MVDVLYILIEKWNCKTCQYFFKKGEGEMRENDGECESDQATF